MNISSINNFDTTLTCLDQVKRSLGSYIKNHRLQMKIVHQNSKTKNNFKVFDDF